MWSWLSENHGAVSALASCMTLVVWLLYFQLLYLGFRNTQRASILISIAGGPQLAAECILANLSREPVYVEAVAISVVGEDGTNVRSLSDLQMDATRSDVRSGAMQGPLGSSEMILLGTFRDLLLRAECEQSDDIRFTLTAIATYSGGDRLVGAEREFLLRGDRLRSTSLEARQLRSWRDRKRLRHLLRRSAVIDRASAH